MRNFQKTRPLVRNAGGGECPLQQQGACSALLSNSSILKISLSHAVLVLSLVKGDMSWIAILYGLCAMQNAVSPITLFF